MVELIPWIWILGTPSVTIGYLY